MSEVSVIMPNYNGLPYLEAAIASVQAQTFQDWELLVADDMSTDNSRAFIEKAAAADSRIKLIKMEVNGGVARARNRALSEASGRYVAFLDSDDLWHSQKLEKQLALMRQKNAAVSATWSEVISEAGKRIGSMCCKLQKLHYEDMLGHRRISLSVAMMDRKLLGQDMQFLPHGHNEDYRLWISILRRGNVVWILPEILGSYRYRRGSRSANKWRSAADIWLYLRREEGFGMIVAAYYFGWYLFGNLFSLRQWKRILGVGQ